MAAYCIKGGGECRGCGACRKEPEYIGECEACGGEITEDHEYYDIGGELVHYDCLSIWARRFLK